jgi:hypothetical protein
MKNIFRQPIITICTAFTLLSTEGCKKLIEVPVPADMLDRKTVFSSDKSAMEAVNGIYPSALSNNQYYSFSVYPGLSADEIYNSMDPADRFQTNTLIPDMDDLDKMLWTRPYTLIYQCNSAIEGLNASSTVSDSVRTELMGEVKFLRGFWYFYLVNLYSDIPLALTTDLNTNATMLRTPFLQVYAQIIADLKDAASRLNAVNPAAQRGKPDRLAASALLARVYLYQKNWLGAEAQASAVINSGSYELSPDLNDVFLTGSPESIWILDPTGLKFNYNTFTGYQFIPSSPATMPLFPVTNILLSAFEPGDQRKNSWLKSNTVNGQLFYYPYKYKVRTGSTIIEAPVCLRLSEQYLIRAEARAEQGNISGAQDDLNRVRSRAGLPNTTSTTQETLYLAIAHERQVELFTEWGDRWLNLRRTQSIDSVLSKEKPGWEYEAALYPIPLNEIRLDASLTENPGY